jgi:hypothetical protein
VDEQSTFVLRVREGNFYRIELPFTTDEEKGKVEEFRRVLATVLQFEKTPSPFRRGYVEETARPQTPLRRTSSVAQPKAKKWRLNKVWEPEDPEQRAKWSPAAQERVISPRRERRPAVESDGSGRSDESAEDEDTITDGSVKEEGDDAPETPEAKDNFPPPVDGSGSPKTFKLPIRIRPMQRSITAPPPLTFETSSPSSSIPLSRVESRDTDTVSIASSRDSFYSTDEQPTVVPGAAQESSNPPAIINPTFPILKERIHQRQISEITIVPDTPTPLSAHSTTFPRGPSDPTTPTLISDTDSNSSDHDMPFQDAPTPPDTLRLRRLPRRLSSTSATSSTIALEPLRSPSIFTTPREPNKAQLLSTALVQKAYSLLIGPPVHLVHVMLEIAARIMRGVRWDGPIVLGERVEKVPGGWVEEDEWSGDESEEEDDFGIPLGNLRRGSDVSQTSRHSRGSFANSSRRDISVSSGLSRADASPGSGRSSRSSVD